MYAVYKPVHVFEIHCNFLRDNVLRFNPVQIAEWLDEAKRIRLVGPRDTTITLARDYGISKSRVLQFLGLMRIPADLREGLKQMQGLTEGELRPVVRMNPTGMRRRVKRMLRAETLAGKRATTAATN